VVTRTDCTVSEAAAMALRTELCTVLLFMRSRMI